MTDHDDHDMREFVRSIFGSDDRTPRDVVPAQPITLDDIRRWSANYDKPVTGTILGDVILDADGIPIGVEPSRTITSLSGGVFISRVDADRLGIAEGD
ncbi:hypothetical protein [Rhodococcus sp. Q]|uniref:hypothetical protein n=1 Tax=Rhodococcus sp. Q TaxID=2502252 RepID=UPI0010F53793|nr:hypothetical protein [Rhodococcus sp. Q]